MTDKIKLEEFLQNFTTILMYTMNKLINEDWKEFDGSMMTTEVFDTMQHYITAAQKCNEYKETFKDYLEQDKKTRGCIFLDEK